MSKSTGSAVRDRDPITQPGASGRRGYQSMNRAMPLRFATLLLSMLYTMGAPRLGVEPGTILMVLGLAGAFMGVDTLRPSGLVKE